jgi:hypothetical protein
MLKLIRTTTFELFAIAAASATGATCLADIALQGPVGVPWHHPLSLTAPYAGATHPAGM